MRMPHTLYCGDISKPGHSTVGVGPAQTDSQRAANHSGRAWRDISNDAFS